VTEAFKARIAKQGPGPEFGTPQTELLYGATARNLSFDKPGRYEVEAVVSVDGMERRIVNRYQVCASPNPKAPVGRVVDTMDAKVVGCRSGTLYGTAILPVRAARLYGSDQFLLCWWGRER
jgi:hypothetical protein